MCLRVWLAYDETKLTPRELRRAGRALAKPLPSWLDKENGRIRAVLESMDGEVAIPKGVGPVMEIIFDVVEDTTTSHSLHVSGEIEAGLGPKRVSVTAPVSVAIALTQDSAVRLTWQPFGQELYTVLYCDDLRTQNWTPVEGTAWPITETSWQGDVVTTVGRRFYRVESE